MDPVVAVMKTEVQEVQDQGFNLSVVEWLPQKHHLSPNALFYFCAEVKSVRDHFPQKF